LASRLRSNKL